MRNEKIDCAGCGQKTARNVHNKCLYCGTPFEERYYFSNEETQEKTKRLKKMDEESRQQLERDKKREKEREEARRKSDANSDLINGIF